MSRLHTYILLCFFSQYIGGNVKAQTSGNEALMTFDFKTTGEGTLLMFAMPHHQQLIDSSSLLYNMKLNTLKGDMIGVVGETWSMTETLTPITWSAPRPIRYGILFGQ